MLKFCIILKYDKNLKVIKKSAFHKGFKLCNPIFYKKSFILERRLNLFLICLDVRFAITAHILKPSSGMKILQIILKFLLYVSFLFLEVKLVWAKCWKFHNAK